MKRERKSEHEGGFEKIGGKRKPQWTNRKQRDEIKRRQRRRNKDRGF